MRNLKNQIQSMVRLPLIFAWLILFIGATIGYLSIVFWAKKSELQALIDVALHTVASSLDAGDWDITLSHLKAVVGSGRVFNLEVSIQSTSGTGSHLAGPIGEIPRGLISLCHQTGNETRYTLRGCRLFIETQEMLSLGLFALVGSLSIGGVLLYVRRTFSDFVQTFADNLGYLAGLTTNHHEITVGAPKYLAQEIADIGTRFVTLIRESEEKNRASILGDLAAQVAHDIRSPIAALDNVVASLNSLPEGDRVLARTAVNRIKDIANSLIEKNRELRLGLKSNKDKSNIAPSESRASVELLSSLVDTIATEKRMQFRSKLGIEIDILNDMQSYGLFAKVQATEFKRILSNLINNSVEALGEHGKVTVSISPRNDTIEIMILDNGKGIPPEVLAKLGQRGATFGKEGGSGLGLYHARTSVESWGGSLNIESKVDQGTKITVTLPRSSAPEWFVSTLAIAQASTVVILDDDSSIHQIWQGRFDSLPLTKNNISIVHLSTPEELRRWFSSHPTSAKITLYLFDYELIGHTETGLSLIEEFSIGRQSILVTSRFEEQSILEHCQRLQVRMIPKGMAGFVPITLAPALERYDAILIDDDNLIHMAWDMQAKAAGKSIKVFAHPDHFMSFSGSLSKDTPIYVDSNLGKGLRGEFIAEQIHKMGFTRVYLATGYEPERFAQYTFLAGVIGKKPPF